MRRLLPNARSFLIHSGQTAALLGVAVLAMAAAPSAAEKTAEDALPVDAGAAPETPPAVAVAVAAGPMVREMTFEQPLPGYRINSRFGLRHMAAFGTTRPHEGVDFAAPTGTAVLSAAEGQVVRVGYEADGYGNFVEVRHPNGMSSFYGHMSRVDVRIGDRLGSAERIGRVGSTGRSTGPHLHFEIRRDGSKIDPERILGRAFAIKVEPAALG
jgi:murein DD-endopeptidase MepM/ murein hydrolase activator NlpD